MRQALFEDHPARRGADRRHDLVAVHLLPRLQEARDTKSSGTPDMKGGLGRGVLIPVSGWVKLPINK